MHACATTYPVNRWQPLHRARSASRPSLLARSKPSVVPLLANEPKRDLSGCLHRPVHLVKVRLWRLLSKRHLMLTDPNSQWWRRGIWERAWLEPALAAATSSHSDRRPAVVRSNARCTHQGCLSRWDTAERRHSSIKATSSSHNREPLEYNAAPQLCAYPRLPGLAHGWREGNHGIGIVPVWNGHHRLLAEAGGGLQIAAAHFDSSVVRWTELYPDTSVRWACSRNPIDNGPHSAIQVRLSA
mmetsp:Transcript_9157/g.18607  ORF Transcript_9157/g.18607 Transcript_9157/m.18607 type:complete len:242 (+) Transcript_9157:347-1072(+)